ncbi:SOS response-associated peptidase [Pseudoroseicyclus aestuarii]|uniref:Abasic site processing protein n=1 Tax=Pseudoroseicyclus aestuarii TaxID=1795041 RepID=A0A318SU47_9RHOB|nr:SOS response-associated peptidase [Pseudoroseicyclus aestuarii]PYE85491.1 putative SOS response-associated peptidase YedK [Pseudoroseicyclus aestuarii]
MCGRMAITLPHAAMAQVFEAAASNDLPEGPNYNVCPTNDVAVVTAQDGARRLRAMRWGLLPRWYKAPNGGPLLINARAETVAEKPAFREAVRQRRGILPASGYYEWTLGEGGAKLPWFVHRRDGAPLAFAALWQDWAGEGGPLTTCAVVSCAAQGTMTAIHARMPVVLEAPDWPLWLGEAGHGAAPLMRPAEEGVLAFHRVDRAVNSNRAAGPELTQPVEA